MAIIGYSNTDYKFELSVDSGSNYTDVSNDVQKMTLSGRERNTSANYAAGVTTPTMLKGNKKEETATAECYYNETGGRAYPLLVAAWNNGTDIMWRLSPLGGQTGEKQITTVAGPIQRLGQPNFDATNAQNALMFQCVSQHSYTSEANA